MSTLPLQDGERLMTCAIQFDKGDFVLVNMEPHIVVRTQGHWCVVRACTRWERAIWALGNPWRRLKSWWRHRIQFEGN